MLLSVNTSTSVPAQVPCGTLSLPSRMSCGWVLACSPWSSDTSSPPCYQAPRLPPLLQQCSRLRRRRWLHPRYPGSHGDAGGGYLYDGYSHLDSRWPRRIESRPAPATPGYWLTRSQSLVRCHHLQQSERLIDDFWIFLGYFYLKKMNWMSLIVGHTISIVGLHNLGGLTKLLDAVV